LLPFCAHLVLLFSLLHLLLFFTSSKYYSCVLLVVGCTLSSILFATCEFRQKKLHAPVDYNNSCNYGIKQQGRNQKSATHSFLEGKKHRHQPEEFRNGRTSLFRLTVFAMEDSSHRAERKCICEIVHRKRTSMAFFSSLRCSIQKTNSHPAQPDSLHREPPKWTTGVKRKLLGTPRDEAQPAAIPQQSTNFVRQLQVGKINLKKVQLTPSKNIPNSMDWGYVINPVIIARLRDTYSSDGTWCN